MESNLTKEKLTFYIKIIISIILFLISCYFLIKSNTLIIQEDKYLYKTVSAVYFLTSIIIIFLPFKLNDTKNKIIYIEKYKGKKYSKKF